MRQSEERKRRSSARAILADPAAAAQPRRAGSLGEFDICYFFLNRACFKSLLNYLLCLKSHLGPLGRCHPVGGGGISTAPAESSGHETKTQRFQIGAVGSILMYM